MKSRFYHIQLNINYDNVSFYKELMNFLSWNVVFEEDDVIGFHDTNNVSLWFVKGEKNEVMNHGHIGVSHVSIQVDEQKNIDEVVELLQSKKISLLYETPRHRPEFAANTDETYYQVMFESPDHILFEIVYTGKKN